MKVKIHQLSGKTIEFDLDIDATIKQLQQKIALHVGVDVFMICIRCIKNQNGIKLLNAIYHDDPFDENLIEFIKEKTSLKDVENLVITSLDIWVTLNFGPGHYRPTQQNPKGVSALVGIMENSDNTFFQSVFSSKNSTTLSSKLKDRNVPEHFLDPITFEIMNTPVIASDLRTYDLTTLEMLKFISPFTREPLSGTIKHNLALRSEMENYNKI